MTAHLVALILGAGVPLAGSVALNRTAGPLARRLRPAEAALLVSAVALVLALASGLSLCVGALYGLARIPLVRRVAHWPLAAAAAGNPVPVAVGLVAGALAVALIASALRRAGIAAHELVVCEMTCRQLTAVDGRLVVLDEEYPQAFTLAALSRRVVVSTGMLRVLEPQERRALLAHEEAHVRHRHPLLLLATQLAGAANPLLRPAVPAVHWAIERWADESAAVVTGDRTVVAASLAKASLAQASARRAARALPSPVLGAVDHHVALRTRALLASPPPPSRGLTAGVLAAGALVAASSIWLAHDTERRFDAPGPAGVVAASVVQSP